MKVITDALNIARSLIGTREELGPNHGKIVDAIEKEFGLSGASWCVMFALHCFKVACEQNRLIVPVIWTASSQTLFAKCAQKGLTYTDTSKLKPGDLVIWQHDNTWTGHCGIVTSAFDTKTQRFATIEGNTSSGESGSQSNGDGVYARTRNGGPDKFKPIGFHLKGFIDMQAAFNHIKMEQQ